MYVYINLTIKIHIKTNKAIFIPKKSARKYFSSKLEYSKLKSTQTDNCLWNLLVRGNC